MGKKFKEFGVPSLQAPNSHRRKKRLHKKLKRRRERYRGLPGENLPQDSLENRLIAFFEINPDLSEPGKIMCEAIARGVERRPNKGRRNSYAYYGHTRSSFPYDCVWAASFKRWKFSRAVHLLGVSEREFYREVEFIANEAQDVLREYE